MQDRKVLLIFHHTQGHYRETRHQGLVTQLMY